MGGAIGFGMGCGAASGLGDSFGSGLGDCVGSGDCFGSSWGGGRLPMGDEIDPILPDPSPQIAQGLAINLSLLLI